MATHTMCKASREGIGFSAVDLNDIRHVYAVAVPRRGSTLRQQAGDALRNIEAVIQEEGTRGSIVYQAVYVADVGQIDECRQIIRDFYGRELPATSYIPQPPCGGMLLSIEALGVGRGRDEVEIERVSEQLVIARHNGIAWVHCVQVVPRTPAAGVYDGATSVLQQIRSLLGSVGVRFDQVIRTWLRLGGIVDDEGPTQRYKELNRARDDFYKDIPFLAGRLPESRGGPAYPASTGIGTKGRGIMMSAIALATERNDIIAMPLENPRQTSAYDYAASYSPRSPKFSRAMALSCGASTTIFISGTASITNSETRHVGDVVAQTHETLNNIEVLISEENLRRHGLPGLGTSLEGLGLARIYIKRKEDYAKTRAVCEKRLGELPTIYAVADVCRPELLVEIEGIAFSRERPSPPHGANSRPHFRQQDGTDSLHHEPDRSQWDTFPGLVSQAGPDREPRPSTRSAQIQSVSVLGSYPGSCSSRMASDSVRGRSGSASSIGSSSACRGASVPLESRTIKE
jgi:enamine deaminase RidA (YjgF/YER057c/UK114 family)